MASSFIRAKQESITNIRIFAVGYMKTVCRGRERETGIKNADEDGKQEDYE